jgi:hypothetical protein
VGQCIKRVREIEDTALVALFGGAVDFSLVGAPQCVVANGRVNAEQ